MTYLVVRDVTIKNCDGERPLYTAGTRIGWSSEFWFGVCLENGAIVPFEQPEAVAITDSSGPASSAAPAGLEGALQRLAGETDLQWAQRASAELRGARGGALSRPTGGWRPPDMDRDLRLALEASAAFERRQAERAAAPPAAAPPRRVLPGREWVRP